MNNETVLVYDKHRIPLKGELSGTLQIAWIKKKLYTEENKQRIFYPISSSNNKSPI